MNQSIKVDSVYLSFGKRQILRGINLELVKNKVIGILGRNGSGKSCLLKIITGQLQADVKHIRYGDKVINNLYKEKGLINYLPQHEFHPKSIVLNNLLTLYGIDQDRFFVQYPFLKARWKSKFSSMSGGDRRLVEVLLVMESNSAFSILDEPFTYLMPKFIDLVKGRIKELKSKKGIVLTDHQYRNVLDISDRSFIISEGIIREIKASEDLKIYGYI
ncbi:MAG: ATP-binding cassette domain-containing protein [Saprospiraceae bacterium]|nr:ATP-binding cassette domain-containing protein [Saprospiraceae bacterium]